MKAPSLKRKVFTSLVFPIVFSIAVIGLAGFYSAEEEIGEIYDGQLITAANVLWALMQKELISNSAPINVDVDDKYLSGPEKEAFNENAESRMFRVWRAGHMAIYSDNSLPGKIGPLPPGFSNLKYDSSAWRVYSLHIPEQDIIVEIGEELGVRRDLVRKIAIGLVIPLLFILPAIAFLIWRGVGKGLKDVEKLSRQVRKRSANDMSPLVMENAPQELIILIDSINALLYKLEESFLREKRFTENAAHELRTPLAALKIQAQLALSVASPEVKAYLAELIAGVERAARLVEELLILAKINPEQQKFKELDLYREVGKVVERFASLGFEKNIEITLREEAKAKIKAAPDVLSLMVSNIIDNAIKYTPKSGRVDIVIGQRNGKPYLTVTDTGLGIPEAEREKVFERFYRLATKVPGSGLGLAIAKATAEKIGATIELDEPESGRGLQVVVEFRN